MSRVFLMVVIVLIKTVISEDLEDDDIKCSLSRLEENIKEFQSDKKTFLPTLKKLKKLYPGEKFRDTTDQGCTDLDPQYICKLAAQSGHCNGTNHELEIFHQSRLPVEEYPKQLGFHLRDPNDICIYQIREMQQKCRATCKSWVEGTDADEMPIELRESGVFEDVVKDNFGKKINICDMKEGWTTIAVDRILGMLNNNARQHMIVPQFHKVGFEKMRLPKDLYAQILTNRKKLLMSKKAWSIEYCVPGMQNCNRIVESETAEECHEVSRENYFYLPLDKNTLENIFGSLLPLAEKWIDYKTKLIGTSVYGIRKYTRGSKLAAHVDHLKTHVISAIINIQQDVDAEWPLQIFDHAGNLHEVLLKPGEMIWYESAKLVHGRAEPLNGSYFENLFVHYMPRGGQWYKTDYNANYGKPVKIYNLEDLREADIKLEDERKRLIEGKLKLELQRAEKLGSLNAEDNWKLLDIV